MPNQARRLVEIDRSIRAGQFPNADQLAVELEVSRRSILKDVEYLRSERGAPVAYSRRRGGYYYTDDTYSLPAQILTRTEIIAFALAVEAARQPLGALLSDDLESAVAKIIGTLDDKVGADICSVRKHFGFAPALASEPTTECAARVLFIYAAIEAQRTLNILYATARTGLIGWRKIEPHHLHNDGGEWQVFAFDRKSGEMRTFNVARVEQLRETGEAFMFQPDFSADDFLAQSFRSEKGPTLYSFAIRFSKTQTPYIIERKWHATQTLEIHPDGGVTLRFKAMGLNEVSRWVLGYGANAQVLKPIELRQIVRDAARGMSAIYGDEAI